MRGLKTVVPIIMAVAGATCGYAQQSGGVSGTVTDPGGAVVPGASVKATNTQTGAVRTVVSTSAGQYVLSPLPVGSYSVEVTKDGFKNFTRNNVVVDINAALTVDFSLSLGSASETVSVNDVTPLINTENQEIGSVRLPEQIQNLPVIVREVQTLIGQTPGVPYGTGSKTSADTDTIGGTFSQGRAEQQFLADGAQLNPFQTSGYPAIDGIGRRADLTVPNVDMIHEFRLVTSGGSAEYANPVAIIVATKSGSNDVHGDAFESYQSGGLSAKFDILGVPASTVPSPSFVRHQFGGSVEGPIKKDKLQFAAAFEEFSHTRIETNPARFPTDSERAGNLSTITSQQLYEPRTSTAGARTAVAGNRLDQDANTPISPVAQAILQLIPGGQPLPTTGSIYNATFSKPEHDRSQKYDGRIDYTINPTNTVFFRTTIGHIDQAFTYTGTTSGTYGIAVKNYYTNLFTGTYTHVFKPNLLARFTLTHRNEPFKNVPTYGNQPFSVPITGLNAQPPFGGPPAITIGTNALSISDISDRRFLNFSDDNDWQFSPNINWLHGKHSVVMGMFYLHGNKTAQLASPPWGQYTTSSDKNNPTSTTSVTGDAFADFLIGYPATTDVTSGISGGYLTKQNISGYVQDSWKPTARITINLGVRYDNYGFFRPGDQRFANADFTNGKIVIPDGTSNMIVPAFTSFASTFESASALGLTNALTYSNSYAFVPRIGVAYRFWNDAVVRAGFGMYDNDVNNAYLADGQNAPPFTFRSKLTRALTTSNGINDLGYTFQNPGASGSTASAATALAGFGGWNPNYPVNQAYEYNLTLEKQLGGFAFSLSYAGNYQNNLSRIVLVNACVPGATACTSRSTTGPDHRQWTQFGTTFGQQAANGTSNYNAVYVEVQRRFSHGFSFDANYAHARLFTYQQTATNPVVSPLWHYDYGPVQAQPYDIFHYNHVFDFPFGKGKRFGGNMNRVADLAVGGWKLSGLGTWQSGQPLTVLGGPTSSPTSATANRADRLCDGRGMQAGTSGIPHSGASFNPACYAVPAYVNSAATNPTRNFGTSGIGTVLSPGVVTYDVNLQKSFTVVREQTLVLRIDAFNPFNHPLLGAPNLDASANAATFGHTTSIVSTYQPRQFQFGAKYNF